MLVGCPGALSPGTGSRRRYVHSVPRSSPEEWALHGLPDPNGFRRTPRWSPLRRAITGLCWIARPKIWRWTGAGLRARRPGTSLPVGDPPGALPHGPRVRRQVTTPSSSHGTRTLPLLRAGTANDGVASFLTRKPKSAGVQGGRNLCRTVAPPAPPATTEGDRLPESGSPPANAAAEPKHVHAVWAVRRVTGGGWQGISSIGQVLGRRRALAGPGLGSRR